MGDALGYLQDELSKLEADGLLLHPRTLEGPNGRALALRRARGDQPRLEQLPGPGEPSPDEPRRSRCRPRARRRLGCGAHDRRLDVDAPRARAAVRRVQARRGRPDVPVRVHGQRRHGGRDPDAGRRHRVRPAQPRLDHRRRAAVEGGDQGVRAQGRRPRRPPARPRPRGRAAASCSSPTACSRWTATSRRCRRSWRSPSVTAPS